MKRIVVTGGAGYLGCVLVRQLALAGHQVTVLDTFEHGGTQPLLSALQGLPRRLRLIELVAGDVCDLAMVRGALADTDALIHLAGVVGYPACDAEPQRADWVNVEGTKVVAQAVSEIRERRGAEGRFSPYPFLFASTGSTYGKVSGLASETLPISPLTRYGRNKAEAESVVRDFDGTCFRLATLFGASPRMRWDLLPHSFTLEAVRRGVLTLFDGGARRTFLHVEDAAAAFVAALDTPGLGSEVFNIGTPEGNVTKRQVADLVAAFTGARIEAASGHDPDARDYAIDYRKVAERLPEWVAQPKQALADTISELVGWAGVWK